MDDSWSNFSRRIDLWWFRKPRSFTFRVELFTIYRIFSKKSENFDDKIHPEEEVSVGFWDISCVRVELKYCGIA